MSAHLLFNDIDFGGLPKNSYVIEVGSVREKQQTDNSTIFLAKLAETNGLKFLTVDFSKTSYELAKTAVGDKAIHSDGAEFLKSFSLPISLLYLDNFDIIYNEKHKASLMSRVGTAYNDANEEITNERSAEVHLGQMKEALLKMTKPGYVSVDNTHMREGKWWGKGAKAVPFLLENGYHIIRLSEDGLLLGNN